MPTAPTDEFAWATSVMGLLLISVAVVLLAVAIVGVFRNRALRPGPRIMWLIVILLVPIFGPIAYLLFSPRTAIRKAEPE